MSDTSKHKLPCTIAPVILKLVAGIGEIIGHYTMLAEQNLTPHLRRENRNGTIRPCKL